jgi:hypothetical protein
MAMGTVLNMSRESQGLLVREESNSIDAASIMIRERKTQSRELGTP